VHELTVLQAIRLKGRVSEAALAATLGEPEPTVAATVGELIGAGLLVTGTSIKLSAAGRARCAELLAAERADVDAPALAAAHDRFRPLDAEFKTVVTDWQLRAGKPNTHDDAGYDAAVLARLDHVHHRVMPIIAAAAAALPRLNSYAEKLETALARIAAGETSWLARPLVDSYHTVWFELHEELILACGLTRRTESRES
jgi:hypothetical protein